MKPFYLLILGLLLWTACGTDSADSTQADESDIAAAQPDALSTSDSATPTDAVSTDDSSEDASVDKDTEPASIRYALPNLSGEGDESVLMSSGPVAIQPAVAVGDDGQAVVVFSGTSVASTDLSIYVARPGSPASLVKAEPGGQRNEPAICRLAAGGFVAVWSYDGQSVGNPLGVEGAILASDGAVLSTFDVITEVEGNHWLGHVGCHPEGGFTVVGSRTDSDDTTFGVFAQHYDSTGTKTGDAFSINPTPEGTQVQPVVAVGEGGTGVVLYEDAPSDGDYVLTARAFDNQGAVGDTFKVLSLGGTDALKPAVAISRGGRAAYAGNLGTQLHLMKSTAPDSPESFKSWTSPFDNRLLPALAFVGEGETLLMASLLDAVGSGVPFVAVDLFEDGNDTPLSSVLLGTDPNLPPYPPSVAWAEGTLAVAWTQRTDGGFEIHLKTYTGEVSSR